MRKSSVNDSEVERLVRSYGNATDAAESSRIAGQIHQLLGAQIRSIIRRRSGYRLDDAQQLEVMAKQAIDRGLAALQRSSKPRNFAAYIALTARGLASAAVAADRGESREWACAMNAIRPYIFLERELRETGSLPDGWERLPLPERVRRLYRQRLDQRFAPAIAWWNRQVQALCPDKAFAVKDAASFLKARRLFTERGIDAMLWKEPSGTFYLSKEAIHPLGIRLTTRLIESMNRREVQAEYAIDARASAPGVDYCAWTAALSARREQVFARLIERLFGRPEFEIELVVGRLLASKREQPRQDVGSKPNPQEVNRYLAALPPELAAEIKEIGWTKVVRVIEQRVAAYLSEPGNGERLASELQLAA